MSNHCECCERMIRFIRKTCRAGTKAASDVKKPASRYVDNSGSSHDDTTQSSAGEGSDSDGSQEESSYCYQKSAKMPAISSSEGFSAEDSRTCAKTALTARVKEEPATDGEDTSSLGPEEDGDNSDGACETPFMLPGRSTITPAQKQKVREKVEAIESTVPVYVAILNRSNVRYDNFTTFLTFGANYASRYLNKNYGAGHHGKKNMISLVLQREGRSKTWNTELRRRVDRTSILKGWASFARGNRLREGDLCLFKRESVKPLKMMVYIIRREKCLA